MADAVQSSGNAAPARICRWHGGKRAALSLRFDDSDSSHIEQAVPMLNEHGLIGTFLVCPGTDDYRTYQAVWEGPVLQRGHELGNHTMNHEGADTDEEAEQQIGSAAELLHRLQPELKLLVFGAGGGTEWFPRKSFAFFRAKYGLVSAGDAASGWAMSCTETYPNWSVSRFAAELEQAVADGVW
ncbi:MAG: polysaccharide deacetylase family protein, partial [Armatimonadetes bacterium]|nr:polysaccharide deacetylase family protein [Armatimonadota bacterium]